VPLILSVLWDLAHTVDVANTIITTMRQPAQSAAPFWRHEPLSYIGWGKTTQLGYGLGLAMGAKLARPDKLCMNVWGDAPSASPAWTSNRRARAHPDPVRAAEQFVVARKSGHEGGTEKFAATISAATMRPGPRPRRAR